MLKDVVPAHIFTIKPYQPGKPIAEVKRELHLDDVIKMASNENPLGPSPRAVEAIRRSLDDLNYYPEDSGFYLREKLSQKLKVGPEMLCLGNGSSEIIVNVGRALLKPGDEILTSEKSFVMYYLCGAYMGNPVVRVPVREYGFDLDAMAAALTPHTRIVFIANPNNPTGTYLSEASLTRFLDKVRPETLVVLDEAYFEYVDAPDYPDGLKLLARYPNLLVLRTFSKIYGLAGIRVGYGVGAPELIDILNRVKLAFNANALGQEAAVAALDDDNFVARSIQNNRTGRDFLQDAFRRLDVPFVPSVTNFIMVLLSIPGETLFDKMQHQGVLVRPLRGFGVPEAIRVTVGRPEENARCLAVFESAMRELGCLGK
ncbi:MAG TPA: histidinol-phosphate transaminase [Acidobacteriota bacterium]|nr:histidinol-phosphate transaminase [Acidobacteriota bacterium]HQM64214.1 histidinol-phosphate transaminase [Acidobacteriota bacterium]